MLALVDAVAYTQAKTGMDGELESLPVGSGQYRQISYGQIQPLLTALTTTGGGRVEVVNSAWERCAVFCFSRAALFTGNPLYKSVPCISSDST